MMKIIAGINPDTKSMCITIITPLIEHYYSNLQGMIKHNKNNPKGITVERQASDTVLVQFPAPPGTILGEPEDGVIKMSGEITLSVQEVINIAQRFCMAALKNITKKTEFCPILDFSGGYSFEELQNDVLVANENKRDFVLIDSYKAYKTNMKATKYEYNQYRINYGTDEYCNFLILVKKGHLSKIRETYKKKLKKTIWF